MSCCPGTSPKSRKPAPERTSLGGGTPAQAAELPLRDRFPKVNMPFPGQGWPEYSAVERPALRVERRNHPISGRHGHEKNIPRGVVYPAAGSPSGRREFDCALDTSPVRVEAAESRFPRRRWAEFSGIRPPASGRPGLPGRAPGPRVRIDAIGLQAREGGVDPSPCIRGSTGEHQGIRGLAWQIGQLGLLGECERIPKIRSPGTLSRSRRTPRPEARPAPGMPCGR